MPYKDPNKIKKINTDYARRTRRAIRLKVINMYGGVCECCKESTVEFLDIDHVNGGGKKHRATFPSNTQYLRWLAMELRPGFRVLCKNCNFAYHFLYGCPHKTRGLNMVQVKDATIEKINRLLDSIVECRTLGDFALIHEIKTDLQDAKSGYGSHGTR